MYNHMDLQSRLDTFYLTHVYFEFGLSWDLWQGKNVEMLGYVGVISEATITNEAAQRHSYVAMCPRYLRKWQRTTESAGNTGFRVDYRMTGGKGIFQGGLMLWVLKWFPNMSVNTAHCFRDLFVIYLCTCNWSRMSGGSENKLKRLTSTFKSRCSSRRNLKESQDVSIGWHTI